MALVLNEEQVMLKDSAAGFLAQQATVAHLRALRDSGSERGFSDDVWRDMAQMGWAGIAIPEAFGGLGYGYTGLGLVLEQAGRNLSASPLQSTVLVGATVIGELGSAAAEGTVVGRNRSWREAGQSGAAGRTTPRAAAHGIACCGRGKRLYS